MSLLDRMRRAWEERGWGSHPPEEQAGADQAEQENIDKGWPPTSEEPPPGEPPAAPPEPPEEEEPAEEPPPEVAE